MSELEDRLAYHLDLFGIEYVRQYKFHPSRKWLADFAILENKLIIEVNGGTWMVKSGHNTGRGISRDYEKSNSAQLLGWTYLQYTAAEIDDGTAMREILQFLGRGE